MGKREGKGNQVHVIIAIGIRGEETCNINILICYVTVPSPIDDRGMGRMLFETKIETSDVMCTWEIGMKNR